MVEKLFALRRPGSDQTLLDPGCGTGAFMDGVLRWCLRNRVAAPRLTGIESDPRHFGELEARFGNHDSVRLLNEDFLVGRTERFDYIIGNPPYVPITGLSEAERVAYRKTYRTAAGRFDLYLLFFEQALKLLKPGGRLVFITPEKFLYVQTAAPLRRLLSELQVEEIDLIGESTFEGLVTYPTITTVSNVPAMAETKVRSRDGAVSSLRVSGDQSSWLPMINGSNGHRSGDTLADICVRISCGVATGADSVFVLPTDSVPPELERFAHPTVSGREISVGGGMTPSHSMLVPYTVEGELLPESGLAQLGDYLKEPDRHAALIRRTCVSHKPWYAFHETPPMREMLAPKILCKDISSAPYFLLDETGELIPRHSVYYMVPKDPSSLQGLCDYLNSQAVRSWLMSNCQRAANGFLRLQSHVLKRLPVPSELALKVLNPGCSALELFEPEPAQLGS